MQESMEALYQEAIRFDSGEIYQSPAYDAVLKNRDFLYRKLHALFGAAILPLLEEYTSAIGEETELECKHYFEQGYRMAQAGK